MAVANNFISSDRFCIAHSNFNPTAAVAAAATDFDVDVVPTTGGTISTVTFDPGDGQAVIPMALDAGDTWTASATYATAGTYIGKVTTVLSNNGETQTDYFTVVVT